MPTLQPEPDPSAKLAATLGLSRPCDVADRVRALGCAGLGPEGARLVYTPTSSQWVRSDRLEAWRVVASLTEGGTVNCLDLAALCALLIEALGGRPRGVRVDAILGQMHVRAGLLPMGCPPPMGPHLFDFHYALAEVPDARGERWWVDTTLGPNPVTALRAADAGAYAEAVFAEPRWLEAVRGVPLYRTIAWSEHKPLHKDEGGALLGLAAVDGGPQLAEPWRSIFWGDEAALAEPGATGGLLRRGAEVFRLVEAGTVRGPVVFERIVLGRVEPARLDLQPVTESTDNDGAVRVELAIYADPQRAEAALHAAGEALPQPQGAPALWSPLGSLGARPEGVLLRQTRWGEVMLRHGRALLRVQPLRRDAGPARDLAVERLFAVMTEARRRRR